MPCVKISLSFILLGFASGLQLDAVDKARLASSASDRFRGQPPDEHPHRVWSRLDLFAAVTLSNFPQMGPVLAKLKAGHPVTVLAFGTSITSIAGGLYNKNYSNSLIKMPTHYMRMQDAWLEHGFLSHFMTYINQSWPHPHHALINLGVPGSTFSDRALGSCLEYNLPQQADILILEKLDALSEVDVPGKALELLIKRLVVHFGAVHRPATILLFTAVLTENLIAGICIKGNPSTCDKLCPDGSFEHSFTPSVAWAHPDEHALMLVAKYYGFAVLSMRTWHTMMLRQEQDLQSPTLCKGMQLLNGDPVHPRALGKLLYTDLLVNYMKTAEELVYTSQDLSRNISWSHQNLMPTEPLNIGGHQSLTMRCYGSDADNPASVHKQFTVDDHGDSMRLEPLETAQGWSYVSNINHTDDKGVVTTRYKPGWVTNKPESDFRVLLNTSFPNMNVTAVSVRFAYLSSYEHMGQAVVSCVSGCSCVTQNVDAHEVRAKVSVQQAIEFGVTQDPACTIQIHTLSQTSSGGHKFKVIQLTVKGWLA